MMPAPSGRYRFALATPEDDAGLRRRMAADWMEGSIAVSFRREPSYFAGCRVQGDAVQVIVCSDRSSGDVAALACRATFAAYVDGRPTRIGYLADLRCAPEHRGGTVLARGYRHLRVLHERDPVPLYTTVIYDGNDRARDLLTSGRAGLPTYLPAGRILTPAIHLDWPKRALHVAGVEIVPGSAASLPGIARFLDAHARTRQFAPIPRVENFGGGRYAGLGAEDFLVARAHGEIVGTIAVWDQSAFRQTHVERYSPTLARIRPFYNLAAAVTPLRPLPSPGARIPYVYLACFAVANDDVALGRALLRAAYRRGREGPWHYAIAGLHERDPLAPLLEEYRRIDAAGRLYVVHYPADGDPPCAIGPGIPLVEAGCL